MILFTVLIADRVEYEVGVDMLTVNMRSDHTFVFLELLCITPAQDLIVRLSEGVENILSVSSNSMTSPSRKNAVLSAILVACCIL